MLPLLVTSSTFADAYRIVRPIEASASSVSYLVEQESLGVRRTLIVYNPGLTATPAGRAAFLANVRNLSPIESDHVVRPLAAGVDDETGSPYVVVEALRGESLQSHLGRRGMPPRSDLILLVGDILHGLTAAHDAGVVHGALSPETIFLAKSRDSKTATFAAKISGFGVGQLERSIRAAGTTQDLRYLAPELADEHVKPTFGTDVCAFALIVFHLLTGRHYFRAVEDDRGLLVLLRELTADAWPAASARAGEMGVGDAIPSGFDAWFAEATRRDPGARFGHAKHLREPLFAILQSGKPRVTSDEEDATERRDWHSVPRSPIASIADAPSVDEPARVAIADQPRLIITEEQPRTAITARRPRPELAPVAQVGGNEPSGIPQPFLAGRRDLLIGVIAGLAIAALASIAVLETRREPPVSTPEPIVVAPPVVTVARAAPPVVAAPLPEPEVVTARPEPAASVVIAPAPSKAIVIMKPKVVAIEPSAVATEAPPAAVSECDPPYRLDANGVRHPKEGCLN